MTEFADQALATLLRAYVLQLIGVLPDTERARLDTISAKLKKQGHASWSEFVEAQMQFPANMPELIVENWTHNRALAREQGLELVPERFAEEFVRANFL